MSKTITHRFFTVAELTHRDGTKSRVSTPVPSITWPGELLADDDVIEVKIIRPKGGAGFQL